MAVRFVPAPNVAQVTLKYTQVGEKCVNVMNFQGTAPWTAATLTSLATALAGWWSSSLVAAVNTGTELDEITVRDLTTQNGLGISYSSGMPVIGTNASGSFPNNVTLAIGLRTGLTGKSFRGRVYYVGLPVGYVTLQRINPPNLASLVTAFKALIDGTVTYPNGAKLSIVSRYSGGAVRPGNATVTPVTAIVIDNVVDSQRRRLPNHNA